MNRRTLIKGMLGAVVAAPVLSLAKHLEVPTEATYSFGMWGTPGHLVYLGDDKWDWVEGDSLALNQYYIDNNLEQL